MAGHPFARALGDLAEDNRAGGSQVEGSLVEDSQAEAVHSAAGVGTVGAVHSRAEGSLVGAGHNLAEGTAVVGTTEALLRSLAGHSLAHVVAAALGTLGTAGVGPVARRLLWEVFVAPIPCHLCGQSREEDRHVLAVLEVELHEEVPKLT